MNASKGRLVEHHITVALFTGMRQSELLGLTWDAVNFNRGTINVNKQLSNMGLKDHSELFSSPKNNKARVITAVPLVMRALQQQRFFQARMQQSAKSIWSNPYGLVFTLENGHPISQRQLIYHFKHIVSAAGLGDVRFHDTRHTYAVNSIRAGDDIKTIQGNLGHASAAFTLDRYGHFTERMAKDSATRMEIFAKTVLNL